MRALLTKIEAYNVDCNGKIFKDMRVVSRWEGFMKLESTDGEHTIIVASGHGPLETSINELLHDSFSGNRRLPSYLVIKASLDILAAFGKPGDSEAAP